jgi:multidrug efflux pump subunit AcrA (membrane-fusion protein)
MGKMNNELVKFNEIEAEISQYHAENEAKIFEYETPAGNKAARSWIYKLRGVRARIADVHKIVKADALAVCQKIDMVKRDLTAQIDTMITYHETPLLQIETREAAKLAEEQRRIQAAKDKAEADKLEAMRKQQAELDARAAVIKAKEDKLAAEKAIRDAEASRVAREKKIADEARVKAENTAKQALANAEKKRMDDIAALKAKAKADALAKDLADKRQKDIAAAEAKKLADIEAKRVTDKKHRQVIETAIYDRLTDLGVKNPVAEKVLVAIKAGKIPNLVIQY